MTAAQRMILVMIERCVAVNGVAPSLEELAKGCGYANRSTVHAVVARLIARGYLAREAGHRPGVGRNLKLTPLGRDALRPVDLLASYTSEALLAEVERRQGLAA